MLGVIPATAYPMGGAWSILIEHPLGSALVQGSAGFVNGALGGYRADAVFLGTGALTRQPGSYAQDYVREIVDTVGATRVFPIHWDDLTLPARDTPVPGPVLVDDTAGAFELLLDWTRQGEGRSFGLLPYWTPVVLFPAP